MTFHYPTLTRRYGRGRGALGLRMRDLLPPGPRWVLVSNYMIDIGWQLEAAPALLRDGLRVVIVHGDRHAEKCCPTPTALLKVLHSPARAAGVCHCLHGCRACSTLSSVHDATTCCPEAYCDVHGFATSSHARPPGQCRGRMHAHGGPPQERGLCARRPTRHRAQQAPAEAPRPAAQPGEHAPGGARQELGHPCAADAAVRHAPHQGAPLSAPHPTLYLILRLPA